jgi:signal transduction histidine kinase
VRSGGGGDRWIAATGKSFFEGGKAVRVLGTMQDITEWKEAEKQRELLLGVLGHDLKNPVNAIAINAQLLARDDPQPTEVARRLAQITASAKRMAKMISELLDFAVSRTGHLRISRRSVDLVPLCRDVVDEVVAGHADRSITFDHPGTLVGAWDGERVAQVMQNLVANAIAHGDPASPVRVAVRDVGEAARLEVRNAAAPIPSYLRERIFEPFQRGTNKGEGLGLGLYIVHEIAEAHGGSVETKSDGGETVFAVTLPKSAPLAE